MSRKSQKTVKVLLEVLPYTLVAWAGNRLAYAYRTAPGKDFSAKLSRLLEGVIDALTIHFLPSLHWIDLLCGFAAGVLVWYIVWDRKQNKKKLRAGREHGSAAWGTARDMEPYTDFETPDKNVILTQTERLTMGRGAGAHDRNKNVLVIGGSGSGKTRFFVKPNLMQLHSSYVITDPKGSLLCECGKMFQEAGYHVKVFNTVNFAESHCYNPFAYFREDRLTEDIAKFIDVFMANTGNKAPGGDDFWIKAEKLIYTAYIAFIFTVCPPEDRNMSMLCEMITYSQASEQDENAQSKIDVLFEGLELWINGKMTKERQKLYIGVDWSEEPTDWEKELGAYALSYYRQYKQAAGKTAKSILVSCSSRLAVFQPKPVARVTSQDELELDKLGDRKTVLFIIISDTNSTFNFLVSILYSQLFDLLCDKAAALPGNRLKIHVRCILDEFSNIGQIPDFEKKISVFRSREISACVILQAMSQLKAAYKDNADTIVANCDSLLFLGSPEMPTLEFMSKMLGKETIDTRNYSVSRGTTGSFSTSDQRIGRELMTPDELRLLDGRKCVLLIRGLKPFLSLKYNIEKHRRYAMLSDANPANTFAFGEIRKPKTRRKVPPLVGQDEEFKVLMIGGAGA